MAPPVDIVPSAPLGLLVSLALPWLVVALPMPLTSVASVALRPSNPFNSAFTSVHQQPGLTSVARHCGSALPFRTCTVTQSLQSTLVPQPSQSLIPLVPAVKPPPWLLPQLYHGLAWTFCWECHPGFYCLHLHPGPACTVSWLHVSLPPPSIEILSLVFLSVICKV